MYTTENVKLLRSARTYYDKLARGTFFVYLFVTFFGTSMPFRDIAENIEEIGTSNLVNQIVFTSLFLLSSLCIIPKRKEFVAFLKREKYLTLFLLWCFLGLFWSDFSFVSFKRLFQIFTTVTVSLAALLYIRYPDSFLVYFKKILFVYIILNFVSIIFIPGALDPTHLTWRGIAIRKNYLGQAAVISIIIWYFAMKSGTLANRTVSFVFFILSIVLLVGSQSMTSLITFLCLGVFGVLYFMDKEMMSLGIGRTFSAMAIATTMILLALIYYMAPEIIESGFGFFGRDITFTGRIYLWVDILEQAKKHLFFGSGFAGFWVVDNPELISLYEKYVWLPNQAHMGYLDLLNETGIVGLCLFLSMLIFYFKNLLKLRTPHYWKWLLISALILNLQETTLFRPNAMTGVLFIFAYLALYAELIHREKSDSINDS